MDQLTETYQRITGYLRGIILNNNTSLTPESVSNGSTTSANEQQQTGFNNATVNGNNSPSNNSGYSSTNGASGVDRLDQFEQLMLNLEQLYRGCQEILTFAHEYDYDPADPANGFRSFVKIITIYFSKLDTIYRVIAECNLNGKDVPPKFVKQLPDYMAVSVPFLVQLSILKLVRAKDLPLRALLESKDQKIANGTTTDIGTSSSVNQVEILVSPINNAIVIGTSANEKPPLDLSDDLDQSSPSVSSSFEGETDDEQENDVASAIESEEEEDSVYTTADESSRSSDRNPVSKSTPNTTTPVTVNIAEVNQSGKDQLGTLTNPPSVNSSTAKGSPAQASPTATKKESTKDQTGYNANNLSLGNARNFYDEFLQKLKQRQISPEKLDEIPKFNDGTNYSEIDQVILEAVLGFGEKDIRPFYTDIRNFWIHDFIRRLLKGLHKGLLMITCPPNQLMKMLFDPTITVDISTRRAVHCSVTDIRRAITVIESKPIRAIQALKYIGKGGSAWMIHVPRQSEWILKAAEGPLSRVTLHRSPRPRVHPRDQQQEDSDEEENATVSVPSLSAAMLSKFRPFANAATCINGNTGSSSSRSASNSVYNSAYSDGNGNASTDPEQFIECLFIKPSSNTSSSSVKSPGSPSSPTSGSTSPSVSQPPKKSLIFHAHGGGFVAMSPRAHQNYLRYWSTQLGVPVICPNYGKAPERPYPCGLQDLLDVYLFLISGNAKVIELIGFHPENIILTGDSAGGNLSPALAFVLNDMRKIINLHKCNVTPDIDCSLRKQVLQMPVALALHYPAPTPTLIFDASKTSVTYDPILTTAKMITFFSAYHALDQSSDPNPWYRQNDLLKEIPKKLSIKAKDPYYNLLAYEHFEDLIDLKLYITACEFDALLDGAISFAKAWKGPVKLDIARDLPHGFLVGAGRKELDKEIHLVTQRIAEGLGIEYSAE